MARRSLVLMSLVGMLLVLAAVLAAVAVVSHAPSPIRLRACQMDIRSPVHLRSGHIDAARATGRPGRSYDSRGGRQTRTGGRQAVQLGAQPIRGDREAPPKRRRIAGAPGMWEVYNSFLVDPAPRTRL